VSEDGIMTSSTIPITTLDVLFFAFGCIVLGLSLLLVGRTTSKRRGLVISLAVLALLLGSTLATAQFSSATFTWLPLAGLTAVWTTGLLLHQMLSRLTLSFVHKLGGINFLALMLIGLGVGSPLAWSQRQEKQIKEYDVRAALLAQLGAQQRNQESRPGLTDRGRVIPLRELSAEIDVAGWTAAEDRSIAAMKSQHKLVRTARPDPASNCHGWVFAGGRYWVDGDDVPKILDDNGYYEVAVPEEGDLIVYTSGDAVVHTGVVRLSDADGTILVESKWGMNSRMLHAPEDQPNWENWQFYHANRKAGHCLRLPGGSIPSKSAEPPTLVTASDR
jgi:hypothetical protein